MKQTKAQKGITLVALIITIIILLILAVVAIRAVQGDGILKYAQNAKEGYEKAEDNERATLDGYLSKIEGSIGSGTTGGTGNPGEGGDSSDDKEVTKGVKVTGTNGIYTEKVGEETLTAIIPVGFCVVKDIEGDANTIERGLVISDVADDDLANSKKGNQFVWIPVEEYDKFHLIEGYEDGALQTYVSSETNPSREAGDSDVAGSPLEKNNVAGTLESIAMYNSVKTNRGFYIARFESGIDAKDENGNQIDNYSLSTKTVADGSVKPLSKKGIGVWNSILVGDDNADGAVKVARSMYIKSNECGVTSTLCYGVQWDAVMNYIEPNYYEQDGTLTSFVANSSGKGNYSGSLALTGSASTYEQKHIFDLAGNVWEYTMESYLDRLDWCDYYVTRGGSFRGSLDEYKYWCAASSRYAFDIHVSEMSFRVALYL